MQVGRDKGNVVMRRYVAMFEDILDPDEMICSIGGDNFAILAKDHKLEQVLKIILKIDFIYASAVSTDNFYRIRQILFFFFRE